MSPGETPDEDALAAMMWDDVTDMLTQRDVSQKRLIEFEEKWLNAGGSPHACKLARLFAASSGSYQAGQGDAIGRMTQEFTNAFKLLREVSGDPGAAVAADTSSETGKARAGHALIMKGGGIKGLAYVGAIEHLSRRYTFDWYVGTSAGAVAAVLLGAGYNADELRQILREKDFRDFFDASWWKKWANLVIHHGLHPANSFTEWLDTLLAEKLRKPSRVMLSDLPSRVTVYASQRNKQALRFDSRDHDTAAAYAVRYSMSIPLVFIPQSDQGLRAYDGGLQHNFPVTDLLSNHPGTPFISLFLGSEVYEPIRQRWVLPDLISIWTESSDAEAITRYRDRTVIIDPRPIGTLDFALTDTEKEFLLVCGRAGALAHLSNGGDEHLEAQRVRDKLKSDVEEARRTKRARRRAWRYLALVAFYVLMAVLALYFWLGNAPRGNNDLGGVSPGSSAKQHRVSSEGASSPKIIEIKVKITVYGDDKEAGESVLEIRSGKRIFRWGYGNQEPWQEGTTHQFTERTTGLPMPLNDPVIVLGMLEERPGEPNIAAGLEWVVTLITDTGSALTYLNFRRF